MQYQCGLEPNFVQFLTQENLPLSAYWFIVMTFMAMQNCTMLTPIVCTTNDN